MNRNLARQTNTIHDLWASVDAHARHGFGVHVVAVSLDALGLARVSSLAFSDSFAYGRLALSNRCRSARHLALVANAMNRLVAEP